MARPKLITIIALIGGVVAWRLVSETMAERDREQAQHASTDEASIGNDDGANVGVHEPDESDVSTPAVAARRVAPVIRVPVDVMADQDEASTDEHEELWNGEVETMPEPEPEPEPETEPEPEPEPESQPALATMTEPPAVAPSAVLVEALPNQPPPAVTASLAAAEIHKLAEAVSPPTEPVLASSRGRRFRTLISILLAIAAVVIACSSIITPAAWWSLSGIIAGIVFAVVAGVIAPRAELESAI